MSQIALSPESLLRGAFYAAENAWHSLCDAALLFQNRGYRNALVLATYSLEDVGRARIYLKHRKQEKAVTITLLKNECRDHAFKLAQAEIPVSVGFSSVGEPELPQNEQEETELLERFASRRERLERDIPKRTKNRRFAALYVDPLDDGIHWNRPINVTLSEAEYWLDTAYVAYLRIREEVLDAAPFEELDRAFWGRERQPRLPEPDWDIFNWSAATLPFRVGSPKSS